MRITTVTLLRPTTDGSGTTTTIAQHLPVQVDQMSTREVVQHQQAYDVRVVDLWKITTFYTPQPSSLQPQRGDILQDEIATEPEKANAPITYKVVGRVKVYDDHCEITAESPVGN